MSCKTCDGHKVVEKHKQIYDCPDCGEKLAIPVSKLIPYPQVEITQEVKK